ncbi:MAG: hypothetical protein DMG28_18265 [Acidobacteria bacterium]|nr:MAG: hypothetical protein DMG28_18265 [Acidobacteriota bacterium]
MRKIKEVLRLKFELGLGQRQIARSCSISQSTVHNYLKRAAAAGLGKIDQPSGNPNVPSPSFVLYRINCSGIPI